MFGRNAIVYIADEIRAEGIYMMYPYMTLADETDIVHSQIIEKDGMKKVIVNFERSTESGFDSARCELPD